MSLDPSDPSIPAIRQATPDDAAAVKRVARASWHATYDDLLGERTVDETVDQWYDPDRLADAARSDDHVLHVADAGDATDAEPPAIVAFAHAVPGEEEDALAHLVRIYALLEWWGEGVGSALLDRTESVLRERGFDRLRLSVFAENEVGVGFYESRGFERVDDREEAFDGETYRAFVYEKGL